MTAIQKGTVEITNPCINPPSAPKANAVPKRPLTDVGVDWVGAFAIPLANAFCSTVGYLGCEIWCQMRGWFGFSVGYSPRNTTTHHRSAPDAWWISRPHFKPAHTPGRTTTSNYGNPSTRRVHLPRIVPYTTAQLIRLKTKFTIYHREEQSLPRHQLTQPRTSLNQQPPSPRPQTALIPKKSNTGDTEEIETADAVRTDFGIRDKKNP